MLQNFWIDILIPEWNSLERRKVVICFCRPPNPVHSSYPVLFINDVRGLKLSAASVSRKVLTEFWKGYLANSAKCLNPPPPGPTTTPKLPAVLYQGEGSYAPPDLVVTRSLGRGGVQFVISHCPPLSPFSVGGCGGGSGSDGGGVWDPGNPKKSGISRCGRGIFHVVLSDFSKQGAKSVFFFHDQSFFARGG